jgi:glycogen operon protein
MTDADWQAGYPRSLAVFLNGDAITEPGPRGERVRDEHFLLLFNAHSDAVTFVLPGTDFADGWQAVVDTSAPPGASAQGSAVELAGRSVMVLRSTGGSGGG